MPALGTWTPLILLAVILGYAIVAVSLFVAPMLSSVLREARQARRAQREPHYTPLRPYPVYLLRFRRIFLVLLLVPPVLLTAAWLWARHA